jgi:hypothetical protein
MTRVFQVGQEIPIRRREESSEHYHDSHPSDQRNKASSELFVLCSFLVRRIVLCGSGWAAVV